MSINKAFVVKNSLEVSTNLIFANADTRRVGVGSTNPQYTLDVNGGIGATDVYVTGVGTFANELNVGLGGTVLTVLGSSNSVGVGTALPAYLLDIRSPVSTGQTALHVQGDVRITGDLNLDDITLDDAEIQDLTVSNTLFVVGLSTFNSNVFVNAALNVSGITTLGNYVDINNSVDISGTLNVGGISTFGGYVDINNSVDIANNLNVTGIGTITTFNSTNGTITNLTGTAGTITTFNSTNGTITNLTGTAGTITTFNSTNGTITNLTGTAGTITTFNSTNGTITNLNVTGISTLGTVRISSGIITATSGVVTYYGDGTYLNLSANTSGGIGIGTTGGVVGYGITFINFYGTGVSSSFYNTNAGIATIFFEGGGGSGTIGIGTVFPVSSISGDLFFSAEFGRLFVYYDENVIGVGTGEFWIDAAPFNVGIITAIYGGVAFSDGSAAAPSWYFENDVTTGVFSPTNGQQTFVSVGSSILNINPNGIVVTGIGTLTSLTVGNINSSGISTLTSLIVDNINSSGISTLTSLTVGNINSSGISTLTSLIVGNINSSGIVTAVDFNSTSDFNLKTNIHTVENALETISSLRGVSFDWKETQKPSIGVIAQELQEVLPELVSNGEIKTVNYNGIIGVLIEAVKELKKEVEELKNTK